MLLFSLNFERFAGQKMDVYAHFQDAIDLRTPLVDSPTCVIAARDQLPLEQPRWPIGGTHSSALQVCGGDAKIS
jgi:hypothetical protein